MLWKGWAWLELREIIPSRNMNLPGRRFPSPQGNTLAFSLRFSRIRPLCTGKSNAESNQHTQGYPGIKNGAESWTHKKLQLAVTQATPETAAGLDQRCLKPTTVWADGGPALSLVPPLRGLCRLLAAPGRPTWHVLPIPLLPGQGIFWALRSWAACWDVLAGAGHPLLTACTEGKGQRRIKALWVILAAQALCGLGSVLLSCQHG